MREAHVKISRKHIWKLIAYHWTNNYCIISRHFSEFKSVWHNVVVYINNGLWINSQRSSSGQCVPSRLPSAWNTTITLHQSFGINIWKCNVIIYIQNCFQINYVIIFCPIEILSERKVSSLYIRKVFADLALEKTQKEPVRKCGKYAESWGFGDVVTEWGRTTTAPARGKSRKKSGSSSAPSSPICFGRSQNGSNTSRSKLYRSIS